MMSKTPRDLTLAVLNRLNKHRPFSEKILEQTFTRRPRLSTRDRAFSIHLIQGVLRYRLRFDWIIKQFIRFPFKKIEPAVLNILYIALYQIYFMDRVPQSAAVNEAVQQARAIGKDHLPGFVNGVLRQICRKKDQVAFPDKTKEPVQYLSVYYSFPEWLVKKWIRELGVESMERILEAENRIPDLVIRANSLKMDRMHLIELLEGEGLKSNPTVYSPHGIRVEGLKGAVNDSAPFKKGLFQVQGEAAQICSHLLRPKPGDAVLDMCAGLGGKSTHLAELMGGKGTVLSLDISHERLIRLSENAQRLGIGCVQGLVADAADNPSSILRGLFDRIMVDGPCSGLGVLSRHPDGKWTRDESDIKRLARLQKKILDQTVPLLKHGGVMLYVTCTLSKEENEDVVGSFLDTNQGMTLIDLRDHSPEWASELVNDQGFFKTLPHLHGMDGFFAALLGKG